MQPRVPAIAVREGMNLHKPLMKAHGDLVDAGSEPDTLIQVVGVIEQLAHRHRDFVVAESRCCVHEF